jgi:putative protease
VYNSLPVCLFEKSESMKNLGFSAFRMDFTIESKDKVKEILKLFHEAFVLGRKVEVDFDHTKGHLKRGVL